MTMPEHALTQALQQAGSTSVRDTDRLLDGFEEPTFNTSWLDGPGESLADNPLLRGMLLELPPKGGSAPDPEWMNRWFEALRAVLDLLYVRR